MAVTVEYQAWDATGYNWQDTTSATSAPVQIYNKLVAWANTVNANPGNVNKQIAMRKGPASSTSAAFVGFGMELGSSQANGSFHARVYTNSTTNLTVGFSSGFTDNGTNGGYGAGSGSATSDTNITWVSSSALAEFSVAQETDEGKEFFCLGWRLNNSTNSSDTLLLFKDANGEWASIFTDGGTAVIGSFYMPVHATPQRNFSITLSISSLNGVGGHLSQLQLETGSATYLPTTGNEYTSVVTAGSNAIYLTQTSSEYGYGRWAPLSGGRKAVCMGYGPFWIVY